MHVVVSCREVFQSKLGAIEVLKFNEKLLKLNSENESRVEFEAIKRLVCKFAGSCQMGK